MTKLESFFWGIIAALGALIVELIIFIGFSIRSSQPSDISFLQLFIIPQFIIIGVFVEEVFKYIVISRRIEMLSFGRSYLTNSFLVGIGFFSVELILIIATGIIPDAKFLAEIATIHIGTAGLIGYITAIKNPKKLSTAIYATILVVFFHSAYNLLILDRTLILNYAIFTLLGLLIFINIINFIRINTRLARD